MNKTYVVLCGLLLMLSASAMLFAVWVIDIQGKPPRETTENRKSSTERPPIKAIMIRGFRENNTSLLGKIDQSLQKTEIPWGDVQHDTNEIVALAKALQTYSPLKGANDSWKNLTTQLIQASTNLNITAQNKDREESRNQVKVIVASCATCHHLHR